MNPPFLLERSGPVPIYLQIEAWIRDQIAAGAWPPRFKLKAEVDLAAELAVSRGTVRKAIAELMAEGLLIQTHGRGTFVAPHVVEQPLADRFVTFSEDLISKGVPFETRLLDQIVLAARGHVATLLRVSPGVRVFYLRRVRLVENQPLILLHNYVVYERCPGIETIDFTAVRLFQALEERYGLHLVGGHRTFQAQGADREVAHLLDMAPGDPVMHVEQQTLLDDGSVIECSNLWLSGDRFRLSADISRTGGSGLGVSLAQPPVLAAGEKQSYRSDRPYPSE